MITLQTVRGKWRLYRGTLTREMNEATCYSLQAALLCANAMAAATKEPFYVTEDLGTDAPMRVYEIAAGGGLPQLKEQAQDAPATNGRMALEVD